MPLFINVPDSANAEQLTPLGGINYNLKFTYNTRDKRYRLAVYLDTELVIGGLKLMENSSPTGKYNIVNFDHGELALIRFEVTSENAGRSNIGFEKAYRLVYLTNNEVDNLQE
jgi:hypothetical protein